MLENTGVPTQADIDGIAPSKERRAKGPVAVIECYQRIPCNPCYTSCKRGAIKELTDINDRPEIDPEKCNGCSVCVSHCPGLAIFVVDESYSDTEALVRLPYEFVPLPNEGDAVTGLDREGNPVCAARVVKVMSGKAQDRTSLVSLAVPKDYAMTVRFFAQEPFEEEKTYLCRCEEITREEVQALIAKGFMTLDEIKRMSRASMGPCQGRTCRQLIMQEIEKATGVKVPDQPMTTYRPPAKPIKLGFLLGGDDDA